MSDPKLKLGVEYDSNVAKEAPKDAKSLEELGSAAESASSKFKDMGDKIAETLAYAKRLAQAAKINADTTKKQEKAVSDFVSMQKASRDAQQKIMKDRYGAAFAKYNKQQKDAQDAIAAEAKAQQENMEMAAESAKTQQSIMKDMYSAAFKKYDQNAAAEAKAQADAAKQAADAQQRYEQIMAESQRSISAGVKQIMAEDKQYASEHKRITAQIQAEEKARAKAAEENKSAFQKFKDNFKDNGAFNTFKGALKGMDFPLKNFTKSLMRIAKLRLLRGIIRSITGAFKEGLSNIYQYSAAMNSMDASNVKGNMDNLASSLLYMKNAVGAAVAPLIAQLVPVIAQVADWFVIAANAVAQFFAILGGQTTYTRAKKQAAEWGQVQSGASGAAAAAQEYKNTILGFDEIHALNDVPENGGGGGGGGGATPDYSSMFEEAPISNELVEKFKDILEIVGAIGAAILAWHIAEPLMDFFNKIGLGSAASAVQAVAGLVITIAGVSLAYSGGYDIGYDGPDLLDLIKVAIGTALGGIGGAMITSAVGLGGAAGLGFGIAISLIATFIGIEIGAAQGTMDRAKASMEEYVGQIDEILNRQNTYIAVSQQAWEEYDATVSKLEYARYLTEQLENLQGKQKLTNEEIDAAKFYIEQLNALNLDGVQAEWDDTHQKIVMNTEAIYDNIDAMIANAKAVAYQKIIEAAATDVANAQADVTSATKHQKKATDDLTQALEECGLTYEDIEGWDTSSIFQLGQGVKDAWTETEIANHEMKVAKDRLNQAQGAMDEAQGSIKDLTFDVKEAAKQTGLTAKQIEDLRSKFINVGNTKISLWDVQQQFQRAGSDAKTASDKAFGLYNALKDLDGIHVAISLTITTATNSVRMGIESAASKIRDLARAARGYANGGFVPGFANGGYFIPGYASGGINSANLFMAHENGAPEMVGRIGNHTAVANTSQMVDAMAQGVYRAMSEVMGSNQGTVEVNVTLDGQRIARAVDNANRVRNRRFNVQA